MTRDEVQKIVNDNWSKPKPIMNGFGFSQDIANLTPVAFTDILVTLGVLKLDKPKTAEDRFIQLMTREYGWPEWKWRELVGKARTEGLKIVAE